MDTNVISELIRQRPDPAVVNWLDSIPIADIATTAITAAELRYGVERLPPGQRKSMLAKAIRQTLDEDFENRVEPFDLAAADHYGSIVARREAGGRPIGAADAQIAAIAVKLDATLATRSVKDFADIGVKLVDPWRDAGIA